MQLKMRIITILQKSSPAAHFICDNGVAYRKMLEKLVKSAICEKQTPLTEVV
jgi:hypothetical protein